MRGRIIDLSHAAAREIELLGPGVTKVRLTVILRRNIPLRSRRRPSIFRQSTPDAPVKTLDKAPNSSQCRSARSKIAIAPSLSSEEMRQRSDLRASSNAGPILRCTALSRANTQQAAKRKPLPTRFEERAARLVGADRRRYVENFLTAPPLTSMNRCNPRCWRCHVPCWAIVQGTGGSPADSEGEFQSLAGPDSGGNRHR